jgi:hypothetical protein
MTNVAEDELLRTIMFFFKTEFDESSGNLISNLGVVFNFSEM